MAEDWVTRREWESWKQDVYMYRNAELEKELSRIIAILNRLSSIVDKAETVTQRAEKIGESYWARVGIISVICSPIIATIVAHFWK